MEKKNAKNDIEIAQNNLPSPSEPPGGIPNIFKSRCYQNLSNTVYRTEIDLVEKKIKFDN